MEVAVEQQVAAVEKRVEVGQRVEVEVEQRVEVSVGQQVAAVEQRVAAMEQQVEVAVEQQVAAMGHRVEVAVEQLFPLLGERKAVKRLLVKLQPQKRGDTYIITSTITARQSLSHSAIGGDKQCNFHR